MGVTVVASGARVNIATSQKVLQLGLQGEWDGSSGAEKNTFVDNNNIEIGGYLFSAGVQTVLNKFTGLLTAEVVAIGCFVESQILSGNWALLDEFIHYGLQTEANSLIGWISKTQTAVNSPVHTPGIGFAFSGTEYINSNFNNSVDLVNRSAGDGIYNVFNTSFTSGALWGNEAGSFLDRGLSGAIALNTAQARGLSNPITSGTLTQHERTASATQRHWIDGVLKETKTGNQNVFNNLNNYIGAINDDGVADTFLIGGISSYSMGAAIGFDHLDYYNNLKVLNAALAAI